MLHLVIDAATSEEESGMIYDDLLGQLTAEIGLPDDFGGVLSRSASDSGDNSSDGDIVYGTTSAATTRAGTDGTGGDFWDQFMTSDGSSSDIPMLPVQANGKHFCVQNDDSNSNSMFHIKHRPGLVLIVLVF